MSELTKQGYDMILQRIKDMTFEPPKELTAFGLQIWIVAICNCQKKIIEMIEEMKDERGR